MQPYSNNSRKKTVSEIVDTKKNGDKLVVLTAYDFSIASIIDKNDIDIILVGDSAGMVMLGYPNTRPVNMAEMLLFCRAVSNATNKTMISVDMPFGSYQKNIDEAISNAVKLIKAGADSVKVEGGEEIFDRIKAMVDIGIPVMGHIGYKPQTSSMWNFSKAAGKTKESALKLLHDAKVIEKAGAFSIVLEMITTEVAEIITKNISIPTIGIGSGPACDGQVLVTYDMLGINQDFKPKFVKKYLDLNHLIATSVQTYSRDVKSGAFPSNDNIIHMDTKQYEEFLNEYGLRASK
ncbi:MAG TPA: 3-methyl-2-oxobutanoate hydroxymethyltransferase [Nitrososphaeraceae archaeon]